MNLDRKHIKKGHTYWLGKHHSDITKQKISNAKIGKKGHIPSKETRIKISCARKIDGLKPPVHRGINHWNWKGGISKVRERLENSFQYINWRQQVFIRDNFTCQICGKIGGELNAHHIKRFSILLKEVKQNLPLFNLYEGAMIYTPLWDLNNGITYCEKCHKKEHNKNV